MIAITNDVGTLTSQQRYLPFGQVRTIPDSPFTNTDYGYTGQRDLGMGLMDYKARFYSPGLGRFIQADSIIPDASNSQAWNRYSYVLNNPIRYNDPTGHWCEPGDYKPGGYCHSPSTTEFLNGYGVTLIGNWTQQQQSYILAGVNKVANALGKQTNKNSRAAFKAVYGITPDDPFKFVMGSCDPRDGVGGCMDNKGYKAGGYTWSSREIEFAIDAPFYSAGGNRSWEEANAMNEHTVVHELGHAFNNRFESGALNPETMISESKFYDLRPYASRPGFRKSPDPDSARGYWEPNRTGTAREVFANMFLGWTYNVWSGDTYGRQRGNYMTTHMADTWLPILIGE